MRGCSSESGGDQEGSSVGEAGEGSGGGEGNVMVE